MAEIHVPEHLVGKKLGEAGIRERFDATVLMIKHRNEAGEETIGQIPSGDDVFQSGDRLLVMGPAEQLRRLELSG